MCAPLFSLASCSEFSYSHQVSNPKQIPVRISPASMHGCTRQRKSDAQRPSQLAGASILGIGVASGSRLASAARSMLCVQPGNHCSVLNPSPALIVYNMPGLADNGVKHIRKACHLRRIGCVFFPSRTPQNQIEALTFLLFAPFAELAVYVPANKQRPIHVNSC